MSIKDWLKNILYPTFIYYTTRLYIMAVGEAVNNKTADEAVCNIYESVHEAVCKQQSYANVRNKTKKYADEAVCK
jgi:hypothetical protein